MIVFVQNAFALTVLQLNPELHRSAKFFFVSSQLKNMGSERLLAQSRVIYLGPLMMRIVRSALGLLQCPIVQPDPLSFSYKVNFFKYLISDGLITELLIDRGIATPRAFYSVAASRSTPSGAFNEHEIIVGSNWLEHGSMTEDQYVSHLRFLAHTYPNGIYAPHPRELSRIPYDIFGAEKILNLSIPLELHCLINGFPRKIVGVCSTILLIFPLLTDGKIAIDLVLVERAHLGGIRAGQWDTVKIGNKKESINIQDLQDFLIKNISSISKNLSIVRQPLPRPSVMRVDYVDFTNKKNAARIKIYALYNPKLLRTRRSRKIYYSTC